MHDNKSREVLVTYQPPLSELQVMAKSIASSKMFGVDNEDQALALMLLCQAEGIHPVMALRRYHIIDGRPAMRADALQGEFEKTGAILWHERSETECSATFFRNSESISHEPAIKRAKDRYKKLKKGEDATDLAYPNELTIIRTIKDAVEKKLAMSWSKDKNEYVLKKNWRQSPRQMLHARCLTEGVRAINPGLVAGVYTEEEIIDIEPEEVDEIHKNGNEMREAVIERNVREATANATGEAQPWPDVVGSGGKAPSEQAAASTNEYGPLTITQDNYKELVSHVGKAQGNVLGKKVGELPRAVVHWLYNNWRNELGPSASDQHLRLKKAIEFAYEDFRKADVPSQDAPETRNEPAPATEPPMTAEKAEAILGGRDIGAKAAYIFDLRQRIEDMVLTEEQAMVYLNKQGVANLEWKSLEQIPEGMLQWLCTPKGWAMFKEGVEKEVKPKVSPTIRKKGRRRK